MNYIKTYLITFVIFFALDIVWLGFIAKDFFRDNIGHLMADKPNWAAAIVFYLVFMAGLIFFAVNPALEKESWQYALLVGGLFGLMCYSTYDMTNLAVLKDWPIKVAVADIIWGTVLNGLTAMLSYFAIRFLS
ncbi:DUF2177 family protein [Facklamia sp. 7083-14-GEN3]|uniref:DUF2177 family protein n=1 Tax=Facklamia sp. 7083-14-GEN3 TaxID=2973478 RepID=UPI00215C9511|nr:DUF2177 family protein [Facklamia sp. 7083-14-GEN3]MCR8969390.1 DUF2177 family protein [Facklamia sp. 7083-14-GEN3]